MPWGLSTACWAIIASIVGGLIAVAIIRPWRFWQARRHCPQCKKTLPRWDCWGWRDGWTCARCGCEIGD